MVKIAVLGYGVVGSGTVEVFYKNKDSIEMKAGDSLDIKYILDLRNFPDSPYADKIIKDFNIILNDPEIKIVVEVIGGTKDAYKYVKQSLEAGKSVVTSNKELVATKGAELLRIAREKNVNYFFEASVGGGIPIIRPLHQCLSANEINEIAGILNGTTNYMLTTMLEEGTDFNTALKNAQKLGYAEGNPTADIEGHDACRKICILASLAFGKHVYPDNIHTEGITNITPEDFEYAKGNDCAIKLIGWASRRGQDKVAIMTCPAFVHKQSQLSGVNDVFNAILVRGDATGDVLFYGKGAGKLPTASAIVSDVIVASKMKDSSKSLFWEDSDQSFVVDYLTLENSFYVHLIADNKSNVLCEAEKLFGNINVLTRAEELDNELAFITASMCEQKFKDKIAKLSEISKIKNTIRVLEY